MINEILRGKDVCKCANPDCVKEFVKLHPKQIYCCKACSNHMWYLKQREDLFPVRKTCAFCGSVFYSTTGAKYCSKDCRLMANGRKKNGKKVRGRGDKPSMSLAEVNKLARAAGLSYGKYLARNGYDGYFDR